MRDQFEEQLRAAEQNIDSYRKRFFDKEEESGEIQDLTMQELAKLKHMVSFPVFSPFSIFICIFQIFSKDLCQITPHPLTTIIV